MHLVDTAINKDAERFTEQYLNSELSSLQWQFCVDDVQTSTEGREHDDEEDGSANTDRED